MKVAQVPFCFYPDPVGGTEVYVESLSKHLQKRGVQLLIAAPGESDTRYTHEGLPIRRFAVSSTLDLIDLYGQGDRMAAQGFGRILEEERPDVVHLHAFTSGVSLSLVEEAKLRRMPIVFTYHTPTVSCQRGTLMRWGNEVCDGRLDLDLCARCTLEGLGLPRAVADGVGRVPEWAGKTLGGLRLSGRLYTALRMRELVSLRHAAVRALLAEVDHVVAVCEWVRSLLVLNGVPPSKITRCRQGLAQEETIRVPLEEGKKPACPQGDEAGSGKRESALRIAFLGRLDPTKGAHLLIQAIRGAKDLSLCLDIYGVKGGPTEAIYLKKLQRLASCDQRIRFCPPIPPHRVVECLKGYDLLAVPSQWLETGPLVVWEAFAAGIPVIGSRLGGIAELVRDGVDGLLVDPGSVGAWSRVLQRLLEEETLLSKLRAGVPLPRTMGEVAVEMKALYERLLTTSAGRGENRATF